MTRPPTPQGRGRVVGPRAPAWVLVLGALGVAYLVLPVVVLASRVRWGQFWSLVTDESSRAALRLSVETALVATAVVIVLGVPVGVVLARSRFWGKEVVRAVVLLPLVLPPVVSGLALLAAFGRRGPVGELLGHLGITVAFSTTAVVIAQAFVAMPFLVLSVEGALRVRGDREERAAATLGARPGRVFTHVTLPAMAPGLAAGALLALARSLGEFGATLTFAGSLQGVTRTLPLEVYLQREVDPDAAVALSMLLVGVAVVIVLVVYAAGGTSSLRAGVRTSLRGAETSSDTLSDDPPSAHAADAPAPKDRA
ncbi:ABC transporter permease [Luteimicrobium subarcticum]|uniref:Molybdate transport system permease protein n=1 Tax=Luteimicrobium subarcticum TaxID=620910 RepID=A0A2M8W1C0_9MICO|nr:ABC transporter permease [Luteimicrobium subarcticum]PJI84732.1 molybdate transport system permease protein [Luteimicrobium subarcticum]